MKKIKFLLILFIFSIIGKISVADEGMWLLMFLNKNIDEMQQKGLKLTAEDIYSINNSSLKDAIIQFGNGCTGEIISSEGLLLTNHHCGYGSIQSHSSVEHDYLTNGFWAMNKNEELPCPNLTARFFVRMEDVSSKVLKGVNNSLSEKEREEIINNNIKKIKAEAQIEKNLEIVVRSFFNGNAYYMFVNRVYTDVRLVGAPPSSIGKFGADTDNWMWPRHTGDFSIFRVYSSKDGMPAKYSADNVPFKPKKHLPVSLKGIKEKDFVMILGYPGTTDRYLTSYGVNSAIKFKNPSIVKIRDKKLEVYREFMQKDPATRIQYSSKYAQTSNYWKYFIGQTKQLVNNFVASKKEKIEQEFNTWVNQDENIKLKYQNVLTDIDESFKNNNQYEVYKWYTMESIGRGAEILNYSRRYIALLDALKLKKDTANLIDKYSKNLTTGLDAYFKDYNQELDCKLLGEMLSLYYNNVEKELQPKYFLKLVKKNKQDFSKISKTIFAKSIFTDKTKLELFLKNPTAKIIEKDLAFQLSKAFFDDYFKIVEKMEVANQTIEKNNRLFIAGLMEMNSNKKFYPNANSTIRLTYGQVLPYSPADAVLFKYYTTIDGIMDKEDPNNWEFVVPAKLKELWKNKDYGEYAENGVLKTCFLSNTDITGGNSGSPVINGEGHLVGLAFDGNWEAMSGDIFFEPELQRTISVDIRYVLFIIDKYAGAKNLINEMTIIK